MFAPSIILVVGFDERGYARVSSASGRISHDPRVSLVLSTRGSQFFRGTKRYVLRDFAIVGPFSLRIDHVNA